MRKRTRVMASDRDQLMNCSVLMKALLGTMISFPVPVHDSGGAGLDLGDGAGEIPDGDGVARRIGFSNRG